MSLSRYIARRFLLAIPVLLGSSLLIFLMIHLSPGDPARLVLGNRQVTQSALQHVRHVFHLDQPLWRQYLLWLGGAVHGDFGTSFVYRRQISAMLMERYPKTLEIGVAAWLISICIGIPAGIVSAVKQYTLTDYVATIGSLAGVSMPVFWQGIMAILLFAYVLGVLPSSGLAMDNGIVANFTHLILPALTLGTSVTALTMRLTRSSMLEVMNEDYIRTARAKGVKERTIIIHHGFQNAMIPVITVIGVQIGFLLAGSVLTETVFGIGGVGRLLIAAINKQDFPTIQAITLIITVIFVALNFLTDVVYTFVNPKIRYE